MKDIELRLNQFKKALNKLKEALSFDNNQEIIRDGTIKRFEFTFESAWKLMRIINKFNGVETNSSRPAIKQAFRDALITNEFKWLKCIEFRNLVSHTYDEDTAIEVYENIESFVPLLDELIKNTEKILKEN